MRFAFSEDQALFRDAAKELLRAECTPEVVRAAWDGDFAGADDVWRKLVDQAVLGLAVPESLGGMGLGPVDLVGILEETGWVALPGPVVDTAWTAPLALAGVAGAAPILEAVARGASVAVGRDGAPVPHAGEADWVLLVSAEGGRVLPRSAVLADPVRSVDRTRRLARVAVNDGEEGLTLDAATTRRVADLSALGAAAQLLGLARWMLHTAVEYAKVREQFRRPIGTFQAVQHHLADARVALHTAEPLVHRAAHSLAHDDPGAPLHVAMAKAQASDAAHTAGRKALQVHGAIGYSTEHDLHLWMKRSWALQRAWGDAAHHRERVASALLDGPAAASGDPLHEGIDP